jgi:putative ABC transport system permease protein
MRRIFRLPLRTRRIANADAEAELASFIEERVEYLVLRGMPPEEARAEALRRLGADTTDVPETIRQSAVRREQRLWLSDAFDDLRADILFALRSLLTRSPGWTAVALLTIALGVGATTTMLRIADTLILRPITYRDAARVLVVRRTMAFGKGEGHFPLPRGIVPEWRAHALSIDDLTPFTASEAMFGVGADSFTVTVADVDTTFLGFAGAHPIIGRNVGPGQICLSQEFWRRQYGGSLDVLGSSVRINGSPTMIVGIMPSTLMLPDINSRPPDVWETRPVDYVHAVAVRLRPGMSSALATTELANILAKSKISVWTPGDTKWRLTLTRPDDGFTFRHTLLMLTGAVLLLLLVACTNLTNLMLARGAARQQELAVRSSLGAGRTRLLRQLVTESIVLAMLGAACAALVGWLGLKLLAVARPANLIALTHVSPGQGVISVALVLAVVTGLTIGVVSALRSARRDIAQTLQRRAASAPTAGRLRGWLVVGEVALSATLLVGALLLVHAVYALQQTHLGFDEHGLYEISYFGRFFQSTHGDFARLARDRAARIPGVERVTVAESVLPLSGRSWVGLSTFETPEQPAPPDAPRTGTSGNAVQPDYFSFMGIPFLAGHTFDQGSLARHEVIVNRSLAFELWPDGNALGRRFRNVVPRPTLPIEPWQTVVGIVPDVVSDLVEGAAHPILYRPFNDADSGAATLIVRVNDRQAKLTLAQFASLVEPGWPRPGIFNVRRSVNQSLAAPNFTMQILVAFAVLGVLLAAIGLFGVISYSVGQRTHEIGVRVTLGATRATIARLVVGDGLRLALIGIGLGLAGAVAGARVMQSMLYGVSRLDPFAFGVGAILLLGVSAAACLAPMLRATAVDPVVAMRAE